MYGLYGRAWQGRTDRRDQETWRNSAQHLESKEEAYAVTKQLFPIRLVASFFFPRSWLTRSIGKENPTADLRHPLRVAGAGRWLLALTRRLCPSMHAGRGGRSSRGLRVEPLEDRRLLAALPYGAAEQDLGEFMLGSVAVTPVFLESDGTLDPSTEDWDATKIAETLAKIDEGLQWWVDTLATLNSVHSLSFTVDTSYASTPFETSYEAISRRSNDYVYYVSEFLAGVGFNQTGNLESDIQAFNHSQRLKHGTDWAFTMFVAPSWNDADGQFDPNGSFRRAFSFAGGLFMVLPSTRPASTIAHETGHMFWGRDEYPGGGTYLQRRGYYNTQNLNAYDNPTPGFEQQPSIMAAGDLLTTAYENHVSPASTLAMVGWQDSDGDGIFDVLDVPHRLTGSGYFDPYSSTYIFDGHAVVQTLPNLNSSGLQNDITLNKIRQLEYRFDDGSWQIYSQPNVAEVDIHMSIPVPSNAQTIEIRARDSETTVVSNVFQGRMARPDQTVVAGINGYVWVDTNRNGLWDLGESGNPGWTVEVRDSDGDPLDLFQTVEPDDFPAGQLPSNFSPEVSISSIGTDVDGRIGIFSESSASTGSMTFWGYSRGSQAYRPTWTDSTRRLQIDFAQPTTTVSIDAIGFFAGTKGRLEAYNAAGELLERYTTSPLAPGQAERMTITRASAEIAYVIAGAAPKSSIMLDNLSYGPSAVVSTDAGGRYTIAGLPPGQYTVLVTPNPPSSFVAVAPATGQLQVEVLPDAATTDVDFGFVSAESVWQNPSNRFDVNDDQFVSAIDVLLVVNYINRHGARSLHGSGLQSPPFIDVNGDSFVSALDALIVVNYLNNRIAGGEGEARSFVALATDGGVPPTYLRSGDPESGRRSAEGEAPPSSLADSPRPSPAVAHHRQPSHGSFAQTASRRASAPWVPIGDDSESKPLPPDEVDQFFASWVLQLPSQAARRDSGNL
ncbi:MAG: hypothetical protein KatS3mg111_2734 [Pirellulaceae bacterium]|nr:MAG: hypothetical protein KatS3mg111_2734 [Pirellulaceae bacterium]